MMMPFGRKDQFRMTILGWRHLELVICGFILGDKPVLDLSMPDDVLLSLGSYTEKETDRPEM
jgi:hypothetical protein